MKSDLKKVQSTINDSQSVLQELVHHIGSQITPKTSNASSASTMSDITTHYGNQQEHPPMQQAYAATNMSMPPAMLHYLQKLDAKLTNLENRVDNPSNYFPPTNFQPSAPYPPPHSFYPPTPHTQFIQPPNVPPFQPRGGSRNGGRDGGRGNGRSRGGRGNGGRGQRRCTILHSYCWSHGAGGHWSWEYKTPKPDHQWNATFENKLNGSTAYCPN